MHITLSVPHDEQRVRALLKFLVRRQTKSMRPTGVLFLLIGFGFMHFTGVSASAVALIALGLVMVFLLEPMSVANAWKAQPKGMMEDSVMTLTSTHLSVTSELFEVRFSWEMVGEIVETPTAWYLLLGKAQAYPLPKELMTEQQQAEFTSFSTWLKSTRDTA